MAIDGVSQQVYTDVNALSGLKRDAKAQTPEALREAARQFESIFTRMMLKTMREASSGDDLFNSQESGFYRDMFDDQISVDMSRGHGLGLADQLVAQMLRAGIVKAPAGESTDAVTPATPGALQKPSGREFSLPAGSVAASPQAFIQKMLPSAVAASKTLGVDATTLLAHAALETGWGRATPTSAEGKASNNLFGIKAGSTWRGESVGAATVEFDKGVASQRVERFRAYDSPQASFTDYVAMLRDSPRYAAALGQGGDVGAFASALQNAGYATDPRYAQKLVAVAQRVRDAVDKYLKDGNSPPIDPSKAPG